MSPAAKDAPSEIDAYIDAAPQEMQDALKCLREVIKAAAPDAVEIFAYGLPGFRYLGRPLVYYGAASKHYGLYGVGPGLLEAIGEDASEYSTSKGTIRFSSGTTVPEQVVTRLVAGRLVENEAAEAARKQKARERRRQAQVARK